MQELLITSQEYLNAITNAININAETRPYDWAILIVAFLSFISSICVAVFAYKLNRRQTKIASAQATISEEQTIIAKKQTEIMEQQNKIDLFDKRYEIYKIILD